MFVVLCLFALERCRNVAGTHPWTQPPQLSGLKLNFFLQIFVSLNATLLWKRAWRRLWSHRSDHFCVTLVCNRVLSSWSPLHIVLLLLLSRHLSLPSSCIISAIFRGSSRALAPDRLRPVKVPHISPCHMEALRGVVLSSSSSLSPSSPLLPAPVPPWCTLINETYQFSRGDKKINNK